MEVVRQSTSSGHFDDEEKHVRVAKALEQVNSLKSRYQPSPPRKAKKTLDFKADPKPPKKSSVIKTDQKKKKRTNTKANDKSKNRKVSRSSSRGEEDEEEEEDDIDTDEDIEEEELASKATRKDNDEYNADDEYPDEVNEEEEEEEEEEEYVPLDFDSYIDRILQRTRTLALLDIATNTDTVEEEDSDFVSDYDSVFDSEKDEEEEEQAAKLTDSVSKLEHQPSFVRTKSSFISGGSESGSSGALGSRRKSSMTSEKLAEARLVHTLSVFLNLPRRIKYQDLDVITDQLLDGQVCDDYVDDDDIDSSSRGSSAFGSQSSASSAFDAVQKAATVWKYRSASGSKAASFSKIADDSNELEIEQRRMFMEANRLRKRSSHGLLSFGSAAGSDSNSTEGTGALGPHRMTSRKSIHMLLPRSSFHNILRKASSRSLLHTSSNLTEEIVPEDEEFKVSDATEVQEEGEEEEEFNETEYKAWRDAVKEDYLAWIQAKIEAKGRKKESATKRKSGNRPRWLVLYEAGKKRESVLEQEQDGIMGRNAGEAAEPKGTSQRKFTMNK